MDFCQWPFPVTCAGELVLKICNIESDTLWCLLTAIHDGHEHFLSHVHDGQQMLLKWLALQWFAWVVTLHVLS